MNYIAIISVLVVIIMFLLYVSTSNKGWNCTENGCVYVSGGSFSSYDKCNSYCKSSSKLSNINTDNNNDSVSNLSCGVVENPIVLQAQAPLQPPLQPVLQSVYPPFSPYVQPPYGYYHPSLYYNDYNNHWRREEKHHHKEYGTKNHNENNIVIHSPTGPN